MVFTVSDSLSEVKMSIFDLYEESRESSKKQELSKEEGMACSLGVLHSHCLDCFNRYCDVAPDGLSSCSMTECKLGCGHRFHVCKQDEHELFCSNQKVQCINHIYGCPVEFSRYKQANHIQSCPASIVRCAIEWNRWPMHSIDKCVKAPLPLNSPHVRCGQLDVALAMRDQRVLVDSMKAPRKLRKSLRNPLTTKYPSVPLGGCRSYSQEECPSADDISDDDGEVPWQATKYPPGLQKSVCEGLYSASKRASENLTYALDYVSSNIGTTAADYMSSGMGLAALRKIKVRDEMSDKTNIIQPEEVKSEESPDEHKSKSAELEVKSRLPETDKQSETTDTGSKETGNDIIDIYKKQFKLHELLGVSLTIECISKYQPKPSKMFTFLCAQNFRRDEYPWHFKNVHNDIHCGLNGHIEQRCPLAYQGCNFTFQKMSPLVPKGQIVHSSLLESFGLSLYDGEEETDKLDVSEQGLLENESNIRKLREATPEIITSYKYDSNIKVLPRFRRSSGYQKCLPEEGTIELSSLPLEILEHILGYLDSFSLNNLSLTCIKLREVCCSRLETQGMVVLDWDRIKTDAGISWKVIQKKWSFSTCFSPIRQWQYFTSSPLFEHLKVCAYNQEKDKNIRTEKFRIMENLDLIQKKT